MIYKLTVLILGIWTFVYTLSYARWEYKRENISAAAGVTVLCFVLVFAAMSALF